MNTYTLDVPAITVEQRRFIASAWLRQAYSLIDKFNELEDDGVVDHVIRFAVRFSANKSEKETFDALKTLALFIESDETASLYFAAAMHGLVMLLLWYSVDDPSDTPMGISKMPIEGIERVES